MNTMAISVIVSSSTTCTAFVLHFQIEKGKKKEKDTAIQSIIL